MPGFPVFFEAGALAVAFGVEAEAHARSHGVDGDYVPDIKRDDVGYEEVDVVGSVGSFVGLVGVDGLDVVASEAEVGGAFDLNAPEAAAVVEDEVVALAVSPGLGEFEAEAFGFEEEGGFGEFSGALGVAAAVLLFWGFCRYFGRFVVG